MSEHMRLAWIIYLFISVMGYAMAEDTARPGAPQEDLEPEVTIIQSEDEMIEEYRVNNQLFMIKVTPRKGYSYYLVDTDGDGRLDTRKNELVENILIPQWPLLRWK